ncbi:MAG: hypothetical protein Athens101428_611, partial [Candidatus Berkelbacteria bacterium Athens1014_28]
MDQLDFLRVLAGVFDLEQDSSIRQRVAALCGTRIRVCWIKAARIYVFRRRSGVGYGENLFERDDPAKGLDKTLVEGTIIGIYERREWPDIPGFGWSDSPG